MFRMMARQAVLSVENCLGPLLPPNNGRRSPKPTPATSPPRAMKNWPLAGAAPCVFRRHSDTDPDFIGMREQPTGTNRESKGRGVAGGRCIGFFAGRFSVLPAGTEDGRVRTTPTIWLHRVSHDCTQKSEELFFSRRVAVTKPGPRLTRVRSVHRQVNGATKCSERGGPPPRSRWGSNAGESSVNILAPVPSTSAAVSCYFCIVTRQEFCGCLAAA